MVTVIILWLTLFFLSLGPLFFRYVLMRNAAKRPWQLKISTDYMPKLSILIPTYNESATIGVKLRNLSRVEYPKDLMEVIVIDSNSDDGTVDIVKNFINQHPEMSFNVLLERGRRGKSAALNSALKHSCGDVVVVSDADCFWPSDILMKAIPFFADPEIGAITGRKILLNSEQTWVTRLEDSYLEMMNLIKLGESKTGSTPFFEGGFSAYRKEVLESFDPYDTGSDDCGTVIGILEKQARAILNPEVRFFTVFPTTWRGRMKIKIRRINQLLWVFGTYLGLLFKNRIQNSRRVVAQSVFTYLFGPLIFIPLVVTTIVLLLGFPFFSFVFLILLIPDVSSLFFEVVQGYLLLLLCIFSLAFKRKFLVWEKPESRALFEQDLLRRLDLI